jgi:hypothetical protein
VLIISIMIGHKIRIVLMIYRFQLPLGRSIDRCFSSGSIAKKARWFFRDHATASALRKFLENNCNNKDSGRAVRASLTVVLPNFAVEVSFVEE